MRSRRSAWRNALALFFAIAGTTSACGSELTGSGGPPLIVGTWAASFEQLGVRRSAVWRFHEDGHVEQLIISKDELNDRTTILCQAHTDDSRFEDRGTKLVIRFGTASTEYLYELTEGGKRLRLEPGVDVEGRILNNYERDTTITQDCRYVDAGR